MKRNPVGQIKKYRWQKYLAMAFFVALGAVCGFFIGIWADKAGLLDRPLSEKLLMMAGLLIGLYLALFVQLILHETGHLVFGLLSGYAFSSFRIFNWIWVRREDGIRLKRLQIAGTGGQCLMTPPPMADGKIPVFWYNLGGSLMNLATGLVFCGLAMVFGKAIYLSALLLMLAATGFALAIANGVPMRSGTVDNDGYNAFALLKNREAMRSFWIQLKVNEQIAKGVRLKDMPGEWFALPSDGAMKNSMVVVLGVLACNRLMDAEEFAEADALMDHILSIDSGMTGLHRQLLLCDRIYCELIGENRWEVLEELRKGQQRRFMKQMKRFPAVLRTEYAYALLAKKDGQEAAKWKGQFERCVRSYPYQTDIDAERALMERADCCRG